MIFLSFIVETSTHVIHWLGSIYYLNEITRVENKGKSGQAEMVTVEVEQTKQSAEWTVEMVEAHPTIPVEVEVDSISAPFNNYSANWNYCLRK